MITRSALRRVLIIAICAASLFSYAYVIDQLGRPGRITPVTLAMDFRAVYCSAQALAAHEDPYRVLPSTTCQHAAADANAIVRIAGIVPTVLPPYAIVPIEPLAKLPFPLASRLWFFALLAAFSSSVLLMTRMTGLPLLGVFASLFLSSFIASFGEGQVGPVVTFFVVLTGWALWQRRYAMVAISSWALAFEPHIAGPVLLAIALFVGPARRWLAAGGAVVALLSIVANPALTVEYLTAVLPLHNASEISYYGQYSLTSVLWIAGMSGRLAQVLGIGSYGLMIAIGLWLTKVALARTKELAYVAFIPAACAVVGGPYVHVFQICVAIPLVLLVAATPGTHRRIAMFSICLLAIPIQDMVRWSGHLSAIAFVPVRVTSRVLLASRDANPIVDAYRSGGSDVRDFVPGPLAGRSLISRIPTWLGLLFALLALAQFLAKAAVTQTDHHDRRDAIASTIATA